jgi:hypothetical protein
MNSRKTVTTPMSLFALLLIANAAWAQTPADDIRGRLKERQKVVITDAQGREFRGRVVQMTDRLITLEQKRDTVDVAYSEITAIDRPKDGVGNGALIGLTFGAAVGAAVGLSGGPDQSASPFCGMGFFDDCGKSNGFAPAVAGGLVGMLLGVSVDALIHHERQIYRRGATTLRISPAVSRRMAAAMVVVSW